jgi:hypothetical protein
MLLDFSFDMPISSETAASTTQKAGCDRNSTVGIAGLLSGYGRCRQRLDERFWQEAQGFAGEGAVAIGGSVLGVEDAY